MRIVSPEPEPREDGDYGTYTSAAYGKPYGSIALDKDCTLHLRDITLDDARRLLKAAVKIEQELTALHARIKAPHGRDSIYKGTCQLCGKAEDDELHAERCGEDGSDGDGDGTIVCTLAPHDPAATRHEMRHPGAGITWWYTEPQQWHCGACGHDYTARRPRCPFPGCHKVREQELRVTVADAVRTEHASVAS